MDKYILLVLMLIASVAAWGHHSRAEFSGEEVEIEGELIQVRWVNPHPELTLRDGSGVTLTIQAYGAAAMLGGRDSALNLLQTSSNVRIAGIASIIRPNYFLGTNALLENGTEAILGPFEARWSEQFVGGAEEPIPVVDAESENRGIFRIWSLSERAAGLQVHTPFREEAIAARAGWDPTDNVFVNCEPRGMPSPMTSPVAPIQFIDRGDEIILRTRGGDLARTIHLSNSVNGENVAASFLGHSVGRWDGNSLVIETTKINFPWFDQQGTPLSEDLHVTERYTLSEDQTRLDQYITFVDPSIFTEPATYTKYLMALGQGEEVMESPCSTAG